MHPTKNTDTAAWLGSPLVTDIEHKILLPVVVTMFYVYAAMEQVSWESVMRYWLVTKMHKLKKVAKCFVVSR